MLCGRNIRQIFCAFTLAVMFPVVGGIIASGQETASPITSPGEIKVRYEIRRGFRKSRPSIATGTGLRSVETIIEQLNRQVALSFDINVFFFECEEDEAYYDKSSREIAICYQKIERFYHLFARHLRGERAIAEATKGATVSLFLHELAHALIDAWELPVTGNEEDAADQFAMLLMLNGLNGGERMALNGALTFRLYAEADKRLKKLYWDSHSLDEQRYYNTMCLIYGHKPDAYEYLLNNGTLPIQRAIQCEDDYPRLKASWQKLLYPYAKRPASQFVIAWDESSTSPENRTKHRVSPSSL